LKFVRIVTTKIITYYHKINYTFK